MHKKRVRERSIMKGALAGLIGGIAGSAAKILAEKIYPPRPQEDAPLPAVLAEKVVGHELPEQQQTLATRGIHWTFGGLAGAAYGAAVEMEPRAAAWRGGAFGLVLNKMTHESVLPKMGLAEATVRSRTRERQSEWVTHVVYGVVTDLVRRVVRRGLAT